MVLAGVRDRRAMKGYLLVLNVGNDPKLYLATPGL